MPQNKLAELRRMVEAMTFASQEYPWVATPREGSDQIAITGYGDILIGDVHADGDPADPNEEYGSDAAGIVALRNNAPGLLAICEAAEAYVECWKPDGSLRPTTEAFAALRKALEDFGRQG